MSSLICTSLDQNMIWTQLATLSASWLSRLPNGEMLQNPLRGVASWHNLAHVFPSVWNWKQIVFFFKCIFALLELSVNCWMHLFDLVCKRTVFKWAARFCQVVLHWKPSAKFLAPWMGEAEAAQGCHGLSRPHGSAAQRLSGSELSKSWGMAVNQSQAGQFFLKLHDAAQVCWNG